NHRSAARQAAPERAAPLRRREGAHRHRADVRPVQIQAEPVLSPRRNRRAARRRQHRPVRRDAARHAAAHAVHSDHAQSKDNGDCRPALRRHDGRARRFEADLGPVELTPTSRRMYPGRLFMHAQASARRRAPGLFVAAVVSAAAAGCGFGPLPGRATEQWTKTYPLNAGGEVRIGNTNGKVEIEGVDGSTVEVRAEKIARAATDDGARQLLPHITITEDVKPDRVSVETGRMSGMLIGARYEVDYHVK